MNEGREQMVGARTYDEEGGGWEERERERERERACVCGVKGYY